MVAGGFVVDAPVGTVDDVVVEFPPSEAHLPFTQLYAEKAMPRLRTIVVPPYWQAVMDCGVVIDFLPTPWQYTVHPRPSLQQSWHIVPPVIGPSLSLHVTSCSSPGWGSGGISVHLILSYTLEHCPTPSSCPSKSLHVLPEGVVVTVDVGEMKDNVVVVLAAVVVDADGVVVVVDGLTVVAGNVVVLAAVDVVDTVEVVEADAFVDVVVEAVVLVVVKAIVVVEPSHVVVVGRTVVPDASKQHLVPQQPNVHCQSCLHE